MLLESLNTSFKYSVILTISFYDMNQKIYRNKKSLQNFSWLQFYGYKLCMIMCTATLHRLLCEIKSRQQDFMQNIAFIS